MKNNNELTKKTFFTWVLRLILVMSFGISLADDTEVFYTESEINNNVLFIMDNSGSMTEEVEGTISTVGEKVTVSKAILNEDEDADEHNSPSTRGTSTSGNLLEMTKDGGNTQIVGMRFRNLNIPKGAVIDSAYIQFTSANTKSATTTLDFKIENSNNRATFTNSPKTNISDRGLYSTTVSWDPEPWNANDRGPLQKTPDLKELIQIMVDRNDWDPNDPIVFVVSGTGERSPKSKDNGDGSEAPELIVTYEEVTGQKNRMQVMQDALRTVLTNAPDNLSVGIMNYGDASNWRKNYPNGVKFPITAVTSLARPIVEDAMELDGTVRWDYSNIPEPNETVTVRTFLSEIADDWEPKGMTPIVDALYEASQYFRGEEVDYGYDYARKSKKWAAHPSTYEGEPINQTRDVGSCDATPSTRTVWGLDNISDWDDGSDTWGYKCPADASNPSGPGTASNCVLTKHDCDLTQKLCNTGWVSGHYNNNCSGVDEDGNPTGCEWVPGYCPNNDWGPTGSHGYCKYKTCRDSDLPKPKYISPMKDGCQSSFMILMSDGKPEYSNGVNTNPKSYNKVKSILNKSSCDITHGFKSGRCGADLTHYLATNDNQPDLNGDQYLNTYVIGFSEGITEDASDYLKSLVTLEDDPETVEKEGYFSATNEAELANAFAQALDEIAQEARSQASPGYSVNVKSGLEHEDDIYIPVFDKSSSSRWSGNLKKFKIAADSDGKRAIQGKAVGGGLTEAMTELGLFKEEAWDLWSTSATPDGDVVQEGGVASLLTDPTIRNLYTNISGDTNVSLNSSANLIETSNAGITKDMLFDSSELGLSNAEATAYRSQLIQFIRGWQNGEFDNSATPKGVARRHMGDMLHTEPVIITYTKSTNNAAKKQYIFTATNEGYLHVFDSTSGEEKFAFMPKELLKNIEPQLTGQGPHKYGIDGSISYWHEDANKNGDVDGSEKVYLYFGMRRGGRSYYALDVSNIDTPILKWKIDGNDSQFSGLGQSWSMPYLTKVLVGSGANATPTEAVVISGGNDPFLDYDEEGYEPADVLIPRIPTMGNDIYIVNAKTGAYLWSLQASGVGSPVTQAIPGGVRILDVNKNGILDRMYFADTGGKVWRLDFLTESLSSGTDNLQLIEFADLGVGSSRKFYNEPDVAYFRSNGKTVFSVSIGSGMRPHPMNEEVDDHMFVLLDRYPLVKLEEDYNDPILISQLGKIEIGVVGGGDTITKSVSKDFEDKKITETDKRGYYVSFFDPGEKVLAPAITFEGSLIFTTLVPEVLTTGELINSCAAPATQGRIYGMNLLTGEGSIDTDGDGVVDDNDIFITISASEIPGTPQRVFNALECDSGECSHEVDIRIGKKSTEVGNMDVEAIESIYWSDPNE